VWVCYSFASIIELVSSYLFYCCIDGDYSEKCVQALSYNVWGWAKALE
jgi:hypothetical protein